MVQESNKGTRHIVLFADAADAEEPGDYQRLLETLTSIGITVSVIGLGSETDSDAAFLKDVAARGKGRIEFTESAEDLPRLFAQEAITVARSSFITEPTPARALPDMVLLGDLPASPFPSVDGYNLTYLRPGATMGVVTTDDYKAPVLAFWHRGLGRVASLTAEVDGQYSQRLNAWSGFQGFAVGIGRWLLGGDPPTSRAGDDRASGRPGHRARRSRSGARARRRRGHSHGDGDDRVAGRRTDPSQRLDLAWVGEDTLEARFPMQKPGIYLGAVRLGNGGVLPLAPLTLPYSPEFEPRVDPEGRPEDAGADRARHRRHRAHDMGRRVRREPASQPADPRARHSARADAARPARPGNRRPATAVVRRRAGMAAHACRCRDGVGRRAVLCRRRPPTSVAVSTARGRVVDISRPPASHRAATRSRRPRRSSARKGRRATGWGGRGWSRSARFREVCSALLASAARSRTLRANQASGALRQSRPATHYTLLERAGAVGSHRSRK